MQEWQKAGKQIATKRRNTINELIQSVKKNDLKADFLKDSIKNNLLP